MPRETTMARERSRAYFKEESCMKKKIAAIIPAALLLMSMAVPAYAAAAGNVSGVIEQTWDSANTQIKEVVNNVVFPALSLVLVVAFFVKVATAYFDYRKHGQFEWAPPAILFVCLVFALLAPQFIWQVIGI
jgi:type IV secretory pathway VirB2 component (pilin)